MCESSIYVEHRKARSKEELVLRTVPTYPGLKGFYSVRGSLLVCPQNGTKAIIDEINFAMGFAQNTKTSSWEGKKNVEVKFTGYNSEVVELPDGRRFFLQYLKEGTRIGIGREVRDLTKALALDQIRADVPVTDDEKVDEKARETARDEIPF